MNESPVTNTRKSAAPKGLSHLVSELSQRNVFKVGAVYGISGWLIIQLANNIFPAFDFPQWTYQFVILITLIGFPIALIFAWAFEITPEGLKKSSEVTRQESIAPQTGRKLNTLIISAMAVLLVFMLIERIYFMDAAAPAQVLSPEVSADVEVAIVNAESTNATNPVISEKSIAVLPFDDFNAGGEDEYFADGLTEEILNALTRTPDLLVASRTSSYQYKDQLVDIKTVADALGVAHVLEGSVRRSTTRLRVTVQLIRASDGFHLWSENYDRQPDDIIAVQEDIAFQIATALQTAMDPQALQQMVQSGTRSVAAYNAYLKGRANQALLHPGNQQTAYEAFEEARRLDPQFAAAHYGAAVYWLAALQPNLFTSMATGAQEFPIEAVRTNFLERIGLAIANARVPDRYYFQAQEAQVNLQYKQAAQFIRLFTNALPVDFGTGIALREFNSMRVAAWLSDDNYTRQIRDALAELPTIDAGLSGDVVWMHVVLGDLEAGRDFAIRSIAKFPEDEFLKYQSQRLLLEAGYVDEARELLRSITGIQLPVENVSLATLRQACAENDLAEATRIFETEIPELDDSGRWHALNHLGRKEEATALLRQFDQEPYLYLLSS
ncbi:MAG: hypothetical protein WD772_11105, partial [Pseudohongiellaceae bacterium]